MVNLKGKLTNKLKEQINTEAFFEAAKELGRLFIFAVIAFTIAKLAKLPETETTIVGLAILRYSDRYLHQKWKLEWRVEKKDFGIKKLKGLTPF